MTEEQIEQLVQRVIARLQPPVLVMVTAAEGYRHEIRRRLAGSGQRLHLAFSDDCSDAADWCELGEVLPPAVWQQALPANPYRALVVPFLDYSLAAQLANCHLQHPVVLRLHDALSQGLPVLALRYHCDPLSELNQIMGLAAEGPYTAHMQATLKQLSACGVSLLTLPALLTQLQGGLVNPVSGAAQEEAQRYLTVADVARDPACASAPGAQLTDAAVDFLKEKKRTLP